MPPHHRRIAKQASHLLDVYELMARQSIHTGEEPSC